MLIIIITDENPTTFFFFLPLFFGDNAESHPYNISKITATIHTQVILCKCKKKYI